MSRPVPAAPALLAAALVLTACRPAALAATPAAPPVELVPVRTAPVAHGPVEKPVRAAGTVATKDEWDLGFKVGGLLASVEVHQGQPVRKGQVLARLDPTEVAAGVRQAREGLDKARRDAARMAGLVAAETAPRTAAEDTRTAEAVAEAALAAAEFNLRHATLTAPDDGWVDRRLAEPGEVVAPGRPVIHLSGQGRGFVVRAALSDRDALGLVPGTPATVILDARPGERLPGTVAELSRSASRGTGTYQVEVRLAPAAAGAPLLAGLTAKVEIERRVPAAGAVPLAAVVDGDGAQGAVFAVEGGRARRVPVRIAFLQGDRAVLASGVEGLDRVVTDGAARLADGRAVRLVD
ncbi:MAG: efflux RND transporter periplasmic adaptor subunit [Anaeromyxobacter sp.]|nr:efflux RND transporter periplasmic adaptor subunit [Anaeromyxobacter sp.]MBL0277119.1 efflux RND transporter periplasmic adaptor subunit [Anaeromyxobacter sp.]